MILSLHPRLFSYLFAVSPEMMKMTAVMKHADFLLHWLSALQHWTTWHRAAPFRDGHHDSLLQSRFFHPTPCKRIDPFDSPPKASHIILSRPITEFYTFPFSRKTINFPWNVVSYRATEKKVINVRIKSYWLLHLSFHYIVGKRAMWFIFGHYFYF